MAYMRRLSPLEATYTKDRATEVCLATLAELGFDLAASTNIKLDLDDRPQKSPRACVIASDPPSIVHLITRAQGGLHDYQAFLHEAGHALHYGGVDPALPIAFRRLSRDHALTEIYSYIVEAISKEPEWHARHFGLSDAEAAQNAEATTFLEAILFRRYEAKLRYELGFWSRFAEVGGTPDGYEEELTAATGVRYKSSGYLADMDPGFYSADYLRAWVRSAQLRRHLIETVGSDWWRTRRPATCSASSSARARGPRARRSRRGSGTTHSIRGRSCTSSAPTDPRRTGCPSSRGRAVTRPASCSAGRCAARPPAPACRHVRPPAPAPCPGRGRRTT